MKSRLSENDYEDVLACIEAIYRCRSLETFPNEILSLMRNLVPCNVAGYNEVNIPLNRLAFVLDPPMPEFTSMLEKFDKHLHEHPVISYFNATGDGQALMISDFIGAREYHQTTVYRDFFRHIDVEDQIAIGVRIEEGFIIGIALNRTSRSFTEKDRRRLNLVRPHIMQAYFHAQERAGHLEQLLDYQQALGECGRGLIGLNGAYLVVHATPGAFECLGQYLPVPSAGKPTLPSRLATWAREKGDLSEPMILHRDTARLVIHRVRQGSRLLLLLSEGTEGFDARALARYKLSARETEVLHWIAEGKSNSEIAIMLDLRPGTVKIYVERMLAKLQVPNRLAAALLARRFHQG